MKGPIVRAHEALEQRRNILKRLQAIEEAAICGWPSPFPAAAPAPPFTRPDDPCDDWSDDDEFED